MQTKYPGSSNGISVHITNMAQTLHKSGVRGTKTKITQGCLILQQTRMLQLVAANTC